MNGHQPRKPSETKPPVIKPVENELDIAALTAQLNALLIQYNNIYSVYRSLFMADNCLPKERLSGVLADIENAIHGLCERIAKREYILEVK